MKTILTISLSAILLVGIAFAAIPDAFANPGHDVTKECSNCAETGTNKMIITVDNDPFQIIGTAQWAAYDPDIDVLFGTHPSCLDPANIVNVGPADQNGAASDLLWSAQDNDGDFVYAHLPVSTGNVFSVSLQFGDGSPIETAIVGGGSGVQAFDGGADFSITQTEAQILADGPEAPLSWRSALSGNDDTGAFLGNLGSWIFIACGFEDTVEDGRFNGGPDIGPADCPNGNGVFCQPGDDNGGQAAERFNVVQQVGGEILPISTTALLIAGISANSLMILPALAVIAGIAFTVLKLQVKRSSI